jgi:hypothetical protein
VAIKGHDRHRRIATEHVHVVPHVYIDAGRSVPFCDACRELCPIFDELIMAAGCAHVHGAKCCDNCRYSQERFESAAHSGDFPASMLSELLVLRGRDQR